MMRSKRWLLAALLLGSALGSVSGTAHAATTNPQGFISDLKSPVTSVANQYKLYPSVMMSQAALESAWGTSLLTTQANNYFGVKGSYKGQSVSMATTEYDANGQLYHTNANFRKYPNAKASMTDNATLLRGGTSYNPKIYSGTWRENAKTYASAANALTGVYATAPTYGSTLISIIKTYKLDSLLDGSAPDVATPAPKPKPKVYSKAKYYGTSGNQTATLSKAYASVRLYNHVKDTRANITKTAWSKVKAAKGKKVYLDMRAVRTATKSGNKTTWYRIRFAKSKSSQRYWVYTSAIAFPKVTYTDGKATLKVITKAGGSTYNHVYNSPYLAEEQEPIKKLTAKSYTADSEAVKTQDGVKSTWYRIKVGKKKTWIAGTAAQLQYAQVFYTAASGKKTLSSKFNKYKVYNHVTTTHFNQQTLKWPKGSKKGTKVTVNLCGFKASNKSTWYRIRFSGSKTNYWVDARALS